MKKVLLTQEMVVKARQEADKLGCLTNSVTKGERNIIGILGQTLVKIHFPSALDLSDYSYEFDFVIRGHLVEVKSKHQMSKHPPKPYYEVSVPDTSRHQSTEAEYYLFTRIYQQAKDTDIYPYGWILGIYPVQQYFKDAKFLPSGTYDSSNGLTFRGDVWNLEIQKLHNLKELLEVKQ